MRAPGQKVAHYCSTQPPTAASPLGGALGNSGPMASRMRNSPPSNGVPAAAQAGRAAAGMVSAGSAGRGARGSTAGHRVPLQGRHTNQLFNTMQGAQQFYAIQPASHAGAHRDPRTPPGCLQCCRHSAAPAAGNRETTGVGWQQQEPVASVAGCATKRAPTDDTAAVCNLTPNCSHTLTPSMGWDCSSFRSLASLASALVESWCSIAAPADTGSEAAAQASKEAAGLDDALHRHSRKWQEGPLRGTPNWCQRTRRRQAGSGVAAAAAGRL